MPDLFDPILRAQRRDRAARTGTETFLFERAFDECIERVALMNQRAERALLIGCPEPSWAKVTEQVAAAVDVCDPGSLFAAAAGGMLIVEDAWEPPQARYDLVIAVGTLDSVNDLQLALRLIGYAMKPNSLFIGAVAGGESLPQLRSAMRAADALAEGAAPHVHPRIEPSQLAPLLESAGFIKPVVDIDRVQLAYRSLGKLIADLRGMGATNVLRARPRPLRRKQAEAAARVFSEAGDGERTTEIIEILHFAAWTAPHG